MANDQVDRIISPGNLITNVHMTDWVITESGYFFCHMLYWDFIALKFHLMSILNSLMVKLGLTDLRAERMPISVFLLDDDRRRHRWFEKRFDGDDLDIAETVEEAKEILSENTYDAIFLDHDLLPLHYESNNHNDFANTGYAIAEWLDERRELQRAATIIVHTRNADAAIPMVLKLRESGRNVEYVAFPMLDLKIKNYWKR